MLNINGNITTPFLLVDLEKIRSKYHSLKSALPEAEIFFAMKANSHTRILTTLLNEGCGVEITSPAELASSLSMGAVPEQIISSNPIKTPQFLTSLHNLGVRRLVFDSVVEADKIARFAPHSQVYLRIKTDNTGSDWPLTNKFGADVSDAPALLRYAYNKGLTPHGLTFHVGSQCLNPQNRLTALKACAQIMDQVANQIHLEVINLGGGLPIKHTKPIPELSEITDLVKEARKTLFSDQIQYYIEPGRFLVGDSAVLVTSVIGKARRNGENWLYLDSGVYNGLMETIEKLAYEFAFDVESVRQKAAFTVAGPSCDSVDTMFGGQIIPDLQVGEKFYILNAGAYTTSYASHFNGFAPPTVVFTDDIQAFHGAGNRPGIPRERVFEHQTTSLLAV